MFPQPLLCLVYLCLIPQQAVVPEPVVPLGSAADSAPAAPNHNAAASGVPVLPLLPKPKTPGIEWTPLSRSALRFLAVMHAFRWATEVDTRGGGVGLGTGYLRSMMNLHGWADGDPYYVNYLGHPAQGAISARLMLNHDPRYGKSEFGANPDYWKGKLRGTAFSWAFSEQFEIGLLSEASIGHIQRRFPQQGFVDHVVTPTVGLGLTLLEDSTDRYLIKQLEGRVRNKWARLALRTGLNPTRSFANLIDGKAPWHRESRAGILTYQPDPAPDPALPTSDETRPAVAPFEFSMTSGYREFASGPCLGGGAQVARRLDPDWQLVLDVNGCKLLGLKKNVSGDALVYEVGPRWTPAASAKWSPYLELLLGGVKITHEQLFPDQKVAIQEANPNPSEDPVFANKLHDLYASSEETNGVIVSAGTGLDYRLSPALAFRVASLNYSFTTAGTLGGLNYAGRFQVTTGMVLRLGTW